MTAYDPDKYYAAYPASAYIESDSDRAYYYSRFNETNLPLMAAYLDADGETFLFYNLCGIITFSVSGDFDDYIFYGKNDEAVAYEKYQAKIVSDDKNYKREGGTSGPKTTIVGTVTCDGSTINSIYLPGGVNFTNGFVIAFRKSGKIEKTVSISNAVNVKHGKLLPLGNITSHLKTYVPPTSHDSKIPVGSATDLGASGTANSYIVDASVEANKNKIFKFKAVKGNSSAVVSGIHSVSILWETYNDANSVTQNSVIAGADFDLQEGNDPYIVFQMPEEALHAGNALIAAKDDGGNILWSWHIWVPATTVAIKDGSALCGANIMDRNLGALVATSMTGDPDPLSIGLYYQWGRKDPFPGIVSFSSNTGAKVAGDKWSAHGELITTEYSIAHPTEYAHIKEVDPGVWNSDDPKDLWNTSEDKKTIYDPCPAGYRVPLYDSSLPMWGGKFDEAWTIDKDNFRFAYGEITFPVGGYIDCWSPSYAKVGERTHIWAAKWYDAERSTCLYYRDGSYYSQKFHKAKAGSVRCVAE